MRRLISLSVLLVFALSACAVDGTPTDELAPTAPTALASTPTSGPFPLRWFAITSGKSPSDPDAG